MNGHLASPLEFLVTTLVELYLLAVLLRFLLQTSRANFYNPVSQFLVTVTRPTLQPLRRVIPGWGGVDLASIVLLLALQLVALGFSVWLRGVSAGPGMLVVAAIADLVALTFNVYIFGILIQALLSWVNPGVYNPVSEVLDSLTRPVLRPVRNLVPPISGIDLSPLFAIIGLQVLKMLVVPALQQLARAAG